MNSAMGLNLQSKSSIDVVPSTPNVQVNIQSSVQNAEKGNALKQGEQGFFSILNTELDALVNIESPGSETLISLQTLENIEEVGELGEAVKFEKLIDLEDLTELDMPQLVLSDIIPLEEPSEALALTEPKPIQQDKVSELSDELSDELGTALQQALLELPENISALPLTPDNKLFIQQQALALVEQKQPKLVEKLQQEGQWLPLKGTLLPLIDETLTQNEMANAEIIKPEQAAPQNLSAKELSIPANSKESTLVTSKDSSLNTVESLEQTEDTELDFKNVFEKNESKAEGSSDKQLLTEAVNKNALSDENSSRPKFTAEAVSTLTNNSLGVNQASINTPTTTAVQTGTTLQLPHNPSPEQWGSALGDKVQWMINTKMDSAEMRIDPPYLGKMDISIKMTDDGTQVVIQTQHAATRDLVDAASYRLKEMLEQAGHEQVNVDVSHKESNQSDGQFSQNDEHDNDQSSYRSENNLNQDVVNNKLITGAFNNHRPGLDLFA